MCNQCLCGVITEFKLSVFNCFYAFTVRGYHNIVVRLVYQAAHYSAIFIMDMYGGCMTLCHL